MDVWIGYDQREAEAFDVAAATCAANGGRPKRLTLRRLEDAKLMWRHMERRGGQLWDRISDAPCSTEFAISRFLVPLLQHTGWCLFTDSDVVFLAPLSELAAHADPRYALQVVKHDHSPKAGTKMDGQIQTAYARKNWSSVMLINADHPAWQRLTLGIVNGWTGRALHGFSFLKDAEIGELPREFNWLVGEQQKPDAPKIAHFTLGGPFLPNWKGAEHDDLWLAAREAMEPERGARLWA